MPSVNRLLNRAFVQLPKRADQVDEPSTLVNTFVDTGFLLTQLKSHDHQVIYGRRGTGKTHALASLAEMARREGDVAVYLDLRTIGSTGGIYGDAAIPFSERGTRLLADTLAALHDELLSRAVERAEKADLSQWGPLLDRLAQEITRVSIVGTIERSSSATASEDQSNSSKFEASLNKSPNFEYTHNAAQSSNRHSEERTTESGTTRHRIHFGALSRVLGDTVKLLAGRRLWLILDEWNHIPIELQPYLADLLRRSVLPVRGITLKIGSIEHRSRFRLITDSDYIGLELGADIAADINLDDFMVFGNDAERAKEFFRELLYKHVAAKIELSTLQEFRGNPLASSLRLEQLGFTQAIAFDEFVRSAEGVPRDAINIICQAAFRAGEGSISVNDIRSAAKTWYQRDKEAAVSAHPRAHTLLHWIINEVIAHRRVRAFLLQSDVRHPLIETLFDARVLHVLKKNVSAKDRPGVRFHVYALDYGCYVDLISTVRAPEIVLPQLHPASAAQFEAVPPDDYRSIRGAILELDRFEASYPDAAILQTLTEPAPRATGATARPVDQAPQAVS